MKRSHSFIFKFLIFYVVAMSVATSTFAANVETDRSWYLAGEPMIISVSIDDALIAYAELSDTQGLAAGVVVGLDAGKGTAVMELPSNLHSGYYVLSVYTRHEAQVYQQFVAVVNPLHKSAYDDIEWVPADSCWAEQTSNLKLQTSKFKPQTREAEGHIVKARIKNVYDGHTYSASQIHPSLSIVGKQIHYFDGQMLNDTLAVFYTFGIHGKQPLVLSARSSTGVSLPIEMISPFATLLPKQLPHLVFHYKRSEVETRSLDMQRHQIAITPAKREAKLGDLSDDTAEDGVPMDYDPMVYGNKPDLTYNLDEYRQFLTVREVLLEYVSLVSKRKVDGVTHLFVRKELDTYVTFIPTLVLIDGMPVFDVERLLNYDARRIHYINIYGDQYKFGNGIYNGILSFVTRSGRLTNYPTEPNVQYLVYEFP
jgi:hypothetical protein